MSLIDSFERPLADLRVSVTDRCNFRCRYCMPRESFGRGYRFLERDDLLSYEEIERLVRLFCALGVRKVRVTGGEPLVRRDLHRLIGALSAIETLEDLTLTTNGVLLGEQAERLAQAGLGRVTVSLDSIEPEAFRLISDSTVEVERVIEGIDAAREAGLSPVKVNVVVRRGVNDEQVLPIARFFRGRSVIVRFIEFMDVGQTNRWRLEEVVSSKAVIERVNAAFPLEPLEDAPMGRVARRWRYADGAGEIGVISSVTEPFCSGCTRARLSPEGRLFLCLFASDGLDLRGPLRAGASDDELLALIRGAWSVREDRYSELRASGGGGGPRVEMSRIGG